MTFSEFVPNSVDGQPFANSGECPCTEAAEHVWSYLDGELETRDCERIKKHLAQCPPCKEQYDSNRGFKETILRSCGCEETPITLRAELTLLVARLRNEACGG